MKIPNLLNRRACTPPLCISVLPIVALLIFFAGIILVAGADAISEFSTVSLLSATVLCILLAAAVGCLNSRGLLTGFLRSARQILPAVPMLVCIAMVGTTWMLSGVVPVLIEYGLQILNPTFFLVITCIVCGVISVLTGSSWSTIATIGVAFMGIGTLMGFNAGWIAGAVISGAYFGDKVSPLSDTTVVASSSCGVDLFEHIRYLMITAMPAMSIALVVYFCVGLFTDTSVVTASSGEILEALHTTFNITPWTLVIPGVVLLMIVLRVKTLYTLAAGSVLGIAGIFMFQPEILSRLEGATHGSVWEHVMAMLHVLGTETSLSSGVPALDDLAATGGITGMLPTIMLILCAMIFGGVMIGSGMLATIAMAITSRLSHRRSLVGTTVGSGLFLNACTADQYLSIIIGANMYRDVYTRYSLEPRLLSRTLEDSVSVTSVLIPWNSCGVTQATVLGVATVVYMPFCIFNLLSPVMSVIMAWTGYKIPRPALKTEVI